MNLPFRLKNISWIAFFLVIAINAAISSAAIYHVAPDGKNSNTGLSRDQAWRTVNHAAGQVVAGDTVLIAGGTYRESVRIRSTGEKNHPITFKSLPGEKVIFDGMNRTLGYAFVASGQSHLRFDSLYFTGFNYNSKLTLPWSDRFPGNDNSAAIILYRCNDVEITRCFSDGRMGGYSGGLVMARDCRDLFIRNNVIISAMGGGVHILYSHNTRVEHNVFLVNWVHLTVFQNNPRDPGSLTHNIFTDNLNVKFHVKLLYNSPVIDEQTHTNGYFVRRLGKDRPWEKAGTLGQWLDGIAQTYSHTPEMISIVDDPQFQGTHGAAPLDRHGQPMFLGDYLIGKEDLDFPDLFATSDQYLSRDIGLQKQVFEDFHFNKQTMP